MTLFFELIFGEETEFYQTLLNEDLIDRNFWISICTRTYILFSIITSATQYPDKLKEVLLSELNKYCGNLDDQEAFELLKNNLLGNLFQV